MSAIARWCFRHRFVVIAAWVVVLVGLGALGQVVKSSYDNSFSLPGTGSAMAQQLLARAVPAQAGDSDTIVWQVSTGTVRDRAVVARMTGALNRIAAYAAMQNRAMREYAERRGWTIALQVREVNSGAAKREAREKLLNAARRREIDLVLVWRLDRWGRSVTDLLATLQELEHLGVGFVSLTEVDLIVSRNAGIQRYLHGWSPSVLLKSG